MSVLKILLSWGGSFVVFLAMDAIWLGVLARDFYRTRLAAVIDMHVNIPAAALFYILHVAGVMIFVTVPSVQAGSGLPSVLFRGALYGLFTYATYDLTNLATVRHWPLSLALVDIAWGVCLNAVVALAGFVVLRRL